MIKDLEAELTRALKKTSNADNLEVAEEANVDESIAVEAKASNEMEIDLKDKQKTKTYDETMIIDIENICTIETINKVNTK